MQQQVLTIRKGREKRSGTNRQELEDGLVRAFQEILVFFFPMDLSTL